MAVEAASIILIFDFCYKKGLISEEIKPFHGLLVMFAVRFKSTMRSRMLPGRNSFSLIFFASSINPLSCARLPSKPVASAC